MDKPISRLHFLRLGSTLGLGSVLNSLPGIAQVAEALKMPLEKLLRSGLTCDYIRPTDLLHLRFIFFNADDGEAKNGWLKPVANKTHAANQHVFMYVQLPSQHVAEDLVANPYAYTDRRSIRRKLSFAATSSFLAFKTRRKNALINLSIQELLDWKANFHLITLDDFVDDFHDYKLGYADALKKISVTLDGNLQRPGADFKLLNSNKSAEWPISFFEAPYKMFLSPIAEPAGIAAETEDPYARMKGEHIFQHPNAALELFDAGDFRIVRPWENYLVYEAHNGEHIAPRFKVIHYLCQTGQESTPRELLPSPMNRMELKYLTMRPEYDRDVWSDFFQVTALGVNTNLYYENPDPDKATLIAWEQRVRYARDNYVSVTFRAVDHFTGLKLRVSVIAERDYLHNVSFLPKMYFVSYAEEFKEYTDPEVVSRMDAVKITPLTKGAYFYPTRIKKSATAGDFIPNAYLADHRTAIKNAPGEFHPERLLEFAYLCVDKAGKTERKVMKMIIIPAENFEITSGSYTYEADGEKQTYTKTTNNKVSFAHIGQLNPGNLQNFPVKISCPPTTQGDVYTYTINKTFGADAKAQAELAATLKEVQEHVRKNSQHYRAKTDYAITFARIEKLKDKRNDDAEAIGKEAANATFQAQSVLLGQSDINPALYPQNLPDADRKNIDNFKARHPIRPGLAEAEVIISQIDQLEGQRRYRKVSFAPSYFDSQKNIDEYHDGNLAKLLFRLHQSETDFFADNYKSAGAMVNPGIEISHVSVFDQGITYNDKVNERAKATAALVAGKSNAADKSAVRAPLTEISSIDVFKPLKAEILGIPVIDIIDDALPIKDLPVFTFLKQAEEAVEKVQSELKTLQGEIKTYLAYYDAAKAALKTLPTSISQLEESLRKNINPIIKSWVDAVLSQYAVKEYYQSIRQLEQKYKTEFDTYKKEAEAKYKATVNAVHKKISAASDIEKTLTDTLTSLQKNELATLEKLLKEMDTFVATGRVRPEHYKEYILVVAKSAIKDYPAYVSIRDNVRKYRDKVTEKQRECYNALYEAVETASAMIAEVVLNELAAATAAYEKKMRDIGNDMMAEMRKKLGKDFQEFMKVLAAVNQIIATYENYAKIYQNLRQGEYIRYAEDLLREQWKDQLNETEIRKKIDETVSGIEAAGKVLTDKFVEQLASELNQLIDFTKPEYEKFRVIKENVITEIKRFENSKDAFEHCARVISAINTEEIIKEYALTFLENQLPQAFIEAKNQLAKYKRDFESYKQQLATAQRDIIGFLQAKLEEQAKALLKLAKEDPKYDDALRIYKDYQRLLQVLRGLSKQKLEYNFSTDRFRSASIGGFINFEPSRKSGKTELKIHVSYETEFELSLTGELPKVKKSAFLTNSALTNFKIGFLQMLFIDFAQVSFVTGSDVKDDMQVKIRNVEFAGPLSFVDAFRQYLQSMDKNLVFDIDATGARIGYSFPLPNITAGYFNFFNFSLSALLTLPFDSRKSLQLNFGIGNEMNKFGITVMGIFGGQGYFNVIVEPKRGIVGMVLVLEFGAIFNLNVGVAWGTAYLVGGIYIRRYYGRYEMRAYILCVGRFSVLGIFSASISFYLGMEGDGDALWGRCAVRVSKRITRFFEISVTCHFEKTIKGAKSQRQTEAQEYLYLEEHLSKGIVIQRSNFHYQYLDDVLNTKDPEYFAEIISPNRITQYAGLKEAGFAVSQNQQDGKFVTTLKIAKTDLFTGRTPKIVQTTFVDEKGTVSTFAIKTAKIRDVDWTGFGTKDRLVSDAEYYGAYYYPVN